MSRNSASRSGAACRREEDSEPPSLFSSIAKGVLIGLGIGLGVGVAAYAGAKVRFI
jgi:hypothetical protein